MGEPASEFDPGVDTTQFNRGALRPTQCFRDGWDLIKDDFWSFFGICLLGVLIGSMGPMGILTGPMMCGIHICLLNRLRGQPVIFNQLFDGFKHFLPSFVATLFMVIPTFVLVFAGYIGMVIASAGVMIPIQAQAAQGGPPEPMAWVFGGIRAQPGPHFGIRIGGGLCQWQTAVGGAGQPNGFAGQLFRQLNVS